MTNQNHKPVQLDGSWSRAARWTLERALRLNGYRSEIVTVDDATTGKVLVATTLTVERMIDGKRLIGGTVPASGVVADEVMVQILGQGQDASEVLRLESDVAFRFNDDDLDMMDIRPIVSRRRWETLPTTTMAVDPARGDGSRGGHRTRRALERQDGAAGGKGDGPSQDPDQYRADATDTGTPMVRNAQGRQQNRIHRTARMRDR